MLELVDLERRIEKATYKKVFPELESSLGGLQRRVRQAGVPVIVVFEGLDAAGKGTAINRLAGAMDPRGFKVHPIGAPTEGEQLYPWLWRFWQVLPADGTFGIFDHSWYMRVLHERMAGQVCADDLSAAYEDIRQFERLLVDDGAVIVKFWLHIGPEEQRKRLEEIDADPARSWRVGKTEWKRHEHYEEWIGAVEEMLEQTSTAGAPWTVVPATQKKFARVMVFETLVNALEAELERREAMPEPVLEPMQEPGPSPTRSQTVLDRVDLTLTLEGDEYHREKDDLQDRLFELEHRLYEARIPAVVAYEGWDAAGKGGSIKRLTRGLDPRGYEVVPIGAPTETERVHHYLWRFWRQVPRAGHITIFDRTWYGRVLVERVEGLCSEREWRRAYREINEFERHLVERGTVVVKFWLHISPEEQLARFEARQENPEKRWKITEEDWRNREKWPMYELAVNDMLQRTSTTYAPWTILEANSKRYARVKALRTVAAALEAALD
jgi:polyphosphate:AMP phosphotransferase